QHLGSRLEHGLGLAVLDLGNRAAQLVPEGAQFGGYRVAVLDRVHRLALLVVETELVNHHLLTPVNPLHLFAAYELGEDKLLGHIKPRKNRARFLEFCRYLRSLYPPEIRIAIICDNFSPHLTTRTDKRVGQWAVANNAEIAYTPTNSSW